jgi:hypothetical protein
VNVASTTTRRVAGAAISRANSLRSVHREPVTVEIGDARGLQHLAGLWPCPPRSSGSRRPPFGMPT